jgi:hypothetical protein
MYYQNMLNQACSFKFNEWTRESCPHLVYNDALSEQEIQVAEGESCSVNRYEVEFTGKMRSSWMCDG